MAEKVRYCHLLSCRVTSICKGKLLALTIISQVQEVWDKSGLLSAITFHNLLCSICLMSHRGIKAHGHRGNETI